jgi:hypothetical protein
MAWRVVVWTRFLATPAAVWAAWTDVDRIGDSFPGWLSFDLGDPEAVRRLLREGGELDLNARLSVRGTSIGMDWPVHLREVEVGRGYVDETTGGLYHSLRHVHRVEPTIGGRARWVDEITVSPRFPPGRLGAELVRSTIVRRHRVAAGVLGAEPASTAQSRVFRVA